MQAVRNSHIIRHTLRHYQAAAIFAGIIIQLNSTIDSMVAGFCRDVNYRYSSGVNCVYLNF